MSKKGKELCGRFCVCSELYRLCPSMFAVCHSTSAVSRRLLFYDTNTDSIVFERPERI